jgi:hypothetical protein
MVDERLSRTGLREGASHIVMGSTHLDPGGPTLAAGPTSAVPLSIHGIHNTLGFLWSK